MTAPLFQLKSPYKTAGDQPEAIKSLVAGFKKSDQQVLVGVTGSGKTFTMANVIQQLQIPTLVVSHNKTLAAQLYTELKEFFPENAVEYFVSYYDYYQPEAYIARTDTYIEKDAAVNDNLDRLRLKATSSILSRPDTIVVASVSCIYGLGAPEDWMGLTLELTKGQEIPRRDLLKRLVDIQYVRSDDDFLRGNFRVRGFIVDIFPSYEKAAFRIEYHGNKIERIQKLDSETQLPCGELEKILLYPAKHFVTTGDRLKSAIVAIEEELHGRLKEMKDQGKQLEAQRLESRTRYDIEMMTEVGYCSGIENYSRHLSGRLPGSKPYTLIDYFPKPYLMIIDESHVTLPQFRGMYHGDFARKTNLVDHGFRLPSALDNRPLKFHEFEGVLSKTVYVSATPAEYELQKASNQVEQVVRPTGLIDPEIDVRPTEGQIDDLIAEIRRRVKRNERTLVTALTKRMSEDLSRYLKDVGIKTHYLHSELDAFERVEVLHDLRSQKVDCVVGVNLLREGLDLPEVSLVAILDADKEGFLRSETSLMQIAGRAARHLEGRVIFYADKITDSMQKTMDETSRRRTLQAAFNKKNGIKPSSIQKALMRGIESMKRAEEEVVSATGMNSKGYDRQNHIDHIQEKMQKAARVFDFEKAAKYRDQLRKLGALAT